MTSPSTADVLRQLDAAANRFLARTRSSANVQSWREHARAHGEFNQQLADIQTAAIKVSPTGVTWQLKGEGLSDDFYLIIQENGPWLLLHDSVADGRTPYAQIGQEGSNTVQTINPYQLLQLFNSFDDTMRRCLELYVGAPAPTPGPNDATVVLPAVQAGPQPGQYQPSKGTAITALVAAILAVPLTFCCLLPGFAAFFLGLYMSRTEINRCKRAGMPAPGMAQAAWIISLLDIPAVLLITILLIVSRVSGFDSGGGY
jgi:hypothetical protein